MMMMEVGWEVVIMMMIHDHDAWMMDYINEDYEVGEHDDDDDDDD